MKLIAFGYHPVINLINSPFFQVRKLTIEDKHKLDQKLLKLIKERKIDHQILNRKSFLERSFPSKNQGIVALIDEYEYLSLKDLFQVKPHSEKNIFIMLDGIEDPHNFGAILRSSAAFSVDGVIIANKNQVPVNSTVIKVSMGGIAYVPICQVSSLKDAINELKKRNYKIISTSLEGTSISRPELKEISRTNPVCLIFGNEHEGIKKSLLKESNFSFFIPINQNITSLNVAASCAATLSIMKIE
jgi:23S rRNA (guanosine2251-2'-O)-methyltransferase